MPTKQPTLPQYFNLLNETDKYQYRVLQTYFYSQTQKNLRNKRIESFQQALEKVKSFALRGRDDDWLRCLVCGIFWIPQGLVVNTQYLKLILLKCKSSINGSLQKMGYNTYITKNEIAQSLFQSLPIFKGFLFKNELRKWCFRQFSTNATLPSQMVDKTDEINMDETFDYDIDNTMIDNSDFDDEKELHADIKKEATIEYKVPLDSNEGEQIGFQDKELNFLEFANTENSIWDIGDIDNFGTSMI